MQFSTPTHQGFLGTLQGSPSLTEAPKGEQEQAGDGAYAAAVAHI